MLSLSSCKALEKVPIWPDGAPAKASPTFFLWLDFTYCRNGMSNYGNCIYFFKNVKRLHCDTVCIWISDCQKISSHILILLDVHRSWSLIKIFMINKESSILWIQSKSVNSDHISFFLRVGDESVQEGIRRMNPLLILISHHKKLGSLVRKKGSGSKKVRGWKLAQKAPFDPSHLKKPPFLLFSINSSDIVLSMNITRFRLCRLNRKFFSFIFKIYTLILEILVPWMLYKPLQIVDRPPHTQGLLLGMQVASLIWKMHQLKFSNERRNTTLLSKNPKMNNAKYFALFMYYNKERSFFYV